MDPDEEQFFQEGEQQVFQESEQHDEVAAPEPEAEVPQTDELLLEHLGIGAHASARRARLQRVVGGALLAGVVLFGLGLLRHYGTPHLPRGAKQPSRQATLSALLPAKPTTGLTSAPGPNASPSAEPVVGDTVPSSNVDTEALIRNARILLEGGHTRDGVAAARTALNANPKNAEPYILLAAGLQDLGRWGEAQTIFATCKQATSSGPNATCRYFAGVGN